MNWRALKHEDERSRKVRGDDKNYNCPNDITVTLVSTVFQYTKVRNAQRDFEACDAHHIKRAAGEIDLMFAHCFSFLSHGTYPPLKNSAFQYYCKGHILWHIDLDFRQVGVIKEGRVPNATAWYKEHCIWYCISINRSVMDVQRKWSWVGSWNLPLTE